MSAGWGKWLCIADRDGRQHVIYYPERYTHLCSMACPCVPHVERSIVIHSMTTAAAPALPRGLRAEH